MFNLRDEFVPFLRLYGWLGYDHSIELKYCVIRSIVSFLIFSCAMGHIYAQKIPLLSEEFGPWNDIAKISCYFIVYFIFLIESWWNRLKFQEIWENINIIYELSCTLANEKILQTVVKGLRKRCFMILIVFVPLALVLGFVNIVAVEVNFSQSYTSFAWLHIYTFAKLLVRMRQYQMLLYIELVGLFCNELELFLNHHIKPVVVTSLVNGNLNLLYITLKLHLKLFLLVKHLQKIFDASLLLCIVQWNFDLLADSYWFVQAFSYCSHTILARKYFQFSLVRNS